jgi:hypothetical protein
VGLAARGTRKTGDSGEPIEDASELAQVKAQARQVNVKSLVTAIALTLVGLVLPGSAA